MLPYFSKNKLNSYTRYTHTPRYSNLGCSPDFHRDNISVRITAPVFFKWLETVKHEGNLENAVGQLLDKGHTLEQLVTLNAIQLYVCGQGCTFEEVTHPVILELSRTYNDASYHFQNIIGTILRAAHALEDLRGLNSLQLRALQKGFTIEQIKDPA